MFFLRICLVGLRKDTEHFNQWSQRLTDVRNRDLPNKMQQCKQQCYQVGGHVLFYTIDFIKLCAVGQDEIETTAFVDVILLRVAK
jgi:hypothetical protein